MSNKSKKSKSIIICPYCGEKYSEERGVCPNCHKTPYGDSNGYTPMSDEKIKKIRLTIGVVLVAVFIAVYLLFFR
ncbi:MAG: hypothetical protein E7370_05560 [Clostridiales bacterium]|nr:hypothetical protein [Clostridiales bacterium]